VEQKVMPAGAATACLFDVALSAQTMKEVFHAAARAADQLGQPGVRAAGKIANVR
jgi:hypothetical protein